MIYGIDVSHWQGSINWAQVARAGVQFAVAKATEGVGYADPTYTTNRAGMIQAGLLPGAYHFLYSHTVSPIAAQVDRFLRVVGDPQGMLCAVDCEERAGQTPPNYGDLLAFTAEFRRRTNQHTLLQYVPRWFLIKHGWPTSGLAKLGPWWQSHYVGGSGTLKALVSEVGGVQWASYGDWTRPTILQYTSRAQVPGVSGPCDGNLYLGTLAQLRTYAYTREDGDDMFTEEDRALLKRVDARLNALEFNPAFGPPDSPYVGQKSVREVLAALARQVEKIKLKVGA